MAEHTARTAEGSRSRVAWFNGRFIAECDVLVPFRDLSFLRGYGAYDMTRTFHGRPYRLSDHVERLYRTLRYLEIDPGMPATDMVALSEETLARNLPLLQAHADYWICQRVTAGLQAVGDEGWEHTGPNVIIECRPLPLRKKAPLLRDGVRLITSATPRTNHLATSARGKMNSYLNIVLASNEVRRIDPNAWPIMLDDAGYLAEGEGCNLFIAEKDGLSTPTTRNILPGICRDTVIRIAGRMNMPVREANLDLYDAANAQEMFLTSTSLCICPVSAFNGRPLPLGIPGPLTKRLMTAFAEEVGCDYMAQYADALRLG